MTEPAFLLFYGPGNSSATVECVPCGQAETVVARPNGEVAAEDVRVLQRSHVCGDPGSLWDTASASPSAAT